MIRKIAERGGVTGLNFCGDFTVEAPQGQEGFATIEGLVRHVKHIVNIGGIGCIGLGTDYDGIGDEMEVDNCLKMPRLAEALKKAGFHESEIDAICFGNVLRVMRDVL
jgi:membrane dipeptidase